MRPSKRLLFVVNVDWFFLSHRLPIALEALRKGYEVHIATSITDKLRELEALGLQVHPLALDRSSTGLFAAWQTFLQIFQVFKAIRPDLVHLITIKPVLLGGIAARLARICAVVAAVSGLGYVFLARGPKAFVQRSLVGMLYRVALTHRNLKVIFQNPDDLENVSQLASLSHCCTAIIRGSGVHLDKYTITPIPPGSPVVMLAARLLADKGVREFIQAARILRGSGVAKKTAVRFVLVGATDTANPASLTEQELACWASEGLVELWGYQTNMSKVLAAASVVVLPSYREGLPKVLIEAAACGRAVITTDVPGCRDAIDAGTTGLLVPVRDPTALARAIQELLENPERCRTMGEAGRALAEQVFDVRQVVKKHMRIYEDLMDRSQ